MLVWRFIKHEIQADGEKTQTQHHCHLEEDITTTLTVGQKQHVNNILKMEKYISLTMYISFFPPTIHVLTCLKSAGGESAG